MRINDGSGRGRAVDTESQFVEHFMAEIPAVLNGKVLIASFMKRREAWDVSSGWRSEIRDYGRAVIDGVTHENRMRVGEVVVSPDHAVVLISSTFIGGDQVCGSVPVVRSICWRK